MDTSRDDKHILSELVDRLREAFPQLGISESRLISSGWGNYAVLVNGLLMFKIPRVSKYADQLRKEIEILPCIRNSPVRLPVYKMISENEGNVMAGYDYIPGIPISSVNNLTAEMIGQLTDFLNFLFDQRENQCLQKSIGRGSIGEWKDRYSDLMEQSFSLFFDILDDEILSTLAKNFSDFMENLSRTISISPVHGDLYRENVLIDYDKVRLTGILDWGDAMMGDPAIDFAALAVDFRPSEIEDILCMYSGQIDINFRSRMEFYWQVEPLYGMLYFKDRNDERFNLSIGELTRRLERGTL